MAGGQDIDVVIIGHNCAQVLKACEQAILASFYTRGKLQLFYVDRCSTDGSLALAHSLASLKVIALEKEKGTPTLGSALSVGWRCGNGGLVQFLFADELLSPLWFQEATKGMTGQIGAINGRREEVNPHQSVYHLLSHLEGTLLTTEGQIPLAQTLIRRSVLEEAGGFDERLNEGVEYDFHVRLLSLGYRAVSLNALMATHELIDYNWEKGWKKLYNQGASIAVAAWRTPQNPYKKRYNEMMRRGAGALIFFLLALLLSGWSRWWLLLVIPSLILLCKPRLFEIEKIMGSYHLNAHDAAIWGWYQSLGVIPQFFGAFIRARGSNKRFKSF